MGAVRTSAAGESASALGARPRYSLVSPVRLLVIVGLLAFVLLGLPELLDSFWLQVMTSVVIYSVVTLGLGLLIGRVGMVSLCQFALLAVGAWVALRLDYATSIPFPLLLLIAGVVTGLIGTLIGLPALRLSGLYLALITLMAAGAIGVVLRVAQFPNGGGGFFGNTAAGGSSSLLPRPAMAEGGTAYYRYCVIVAGLMFLLALWHVRGKAGRAWAAIRQSQPTALASGVNTTLYKLWAFALASFMAGVAGGLLAAATGGVNTNQFPTQNSIILLAVVLMGGIYSIWGAILAALFLRLLPGAARRLGGVDGAADDPVRSRCPAGAPDRARRADRPGAEGPGEAPAGAGPAVPEVVREGLGGMIEVSALTVRFGGVIPIDGMTVTFPGGTCGLIGPNGAGKTTFFNVLSGFVRPAAGSVRAFGEDILAMADYRRARWGLRRTFQTEQAVEDLSVFDNVLMVHENTSSDRSSRREEVAEALAFVGLDKVASQTVAVLGARERRLVEVARAVTGKPRVVLLDEPAAGLPDEETEHLGRVISSIPEKFGALVILVDHDMSLVSACCQTTAVLDFGKLIASGPTAEVLRDEHVMRAYIGTEEEL